MGAWNVKIACYDTVEKTWTVYSNTAEAVKKTGIKDSTITNGKFYRRLCSNRYFFCNAEHMELFPEEVILDREKAAAVDLGSTKRHFAVMDIRRSDLGWKKFYGLDSLSEYIGVPKVTISASLFNHYLLKKRYIVCLEKDIDKLDIPYLLYDDRDKDSYYFWPTDEKSKHELYKRLQIGMEYHPKYNSIEKLNELIRYANQKAEEEHIESYSYEKKKRKSK